MHSHDVAAVLGSIAANIRRRRTIRGWTQEQLAEAAKLEPRYVQTLESGHANPTVSVLVALAAALEVKPGVLFRPATLPPTRMGRPPRRRARRN